MPAGGDLELALRIRADLQDATRELKRLRGDVRATGDSARQAGRGTDRYSASMRRAVAASASLTSQQRKLATLNRNLTGAQSRVAGTSQQMAAGVERGARSVDRLGRESARAERRLTGVARSMRLVRRIGAGLGIVFGAHLAVQAARGYARLTDSLTEARTQLRLVTDSQSDLIDTERQLLELSQNTRTEFGATVQLYARLARSTEHLEVTQADLLTVTTAVQQSIRISGATAAESTAGVIQFAQGLASNRLAGEELRSVLEQMPRLARAIADSLGVTVGELRDMAAAGELTTDVVFPALIKQAPQLAAEFANVERTVGQAATQLVNEFLHLVGAFDDATSAGEGFKGVLDDIRDSAKAVREEFAGGPVTADNVDALLQNAIGRLFDLTAEDAAPGAQPSVLRNARIARLNGVIEELSEALPGAIDAAIENYQRTIDELESPTGLFGLPRQRDALEEQRFRDAEQRLEELIRIREQRRAERQRQLDALRDRAGEEDDEAFIPESALNAARQLEDALKSSADRQVGAVARARDGILAQLDLTLEGHREYAVQVSQVANQVIEQVYEKEAEAAEAAAAREAAAEQRRADAVERQRQRAAAAIDRARLGLLSEHERAIALIDQEERTLLGLLETLELTGEAYEEARSVIARYADAQRDAADADVLAAQAAQQAAQAREDEQALREATDFRSGAVRALRDVSVIAEDSASQIEYAIRNGFYGAQEAVVEFARTGKLSFGSLVDSIIADLTRLALQQQILAPLAQLFGGLFGAGQQLGVPLGDGSAFAGFAHSGGIGGHLRVGRRLPSALFFGAPRFHQGRFPGLRPDEMPAVIRRDEGIFTPEQMAALGQRGPMRVEVAIANESNTPIEAREATAHVDADRLVIGVVVDSIANGGAVGAVLQNTYGLRRPPV